MGIKAGGGRAIHQAMCWAHGWRWRAQLAIAAFALIGCAQTQTARLTADDWQRATPNTPQLIARSFYGPRSITDALILEMQDAALSARRWTRFGNGMVSLRFENDRGRRLPAVQCGGHLVVTGEPGQAWRLLVKNETDVPIEVLPSVDGIDLETGEVADLRRRGRLLAPRETTLFTSIADAEGRAVPLAFREISDTSALHRITPTGTLGSVIVCVFLPDGKDSFFTRPLLERRLPDLPGALGTIPRRRYEPMLLPYQYR